MKRVVDKMRTLLVDGPASVTLVSGDLCVFRFPDIGECVRCFYGV